MLCHILETACDGRYVHALAHIGLHQELICFELGLFKVAFTGVGALPSAVDRAAALPNTAALALRYQQLPGDEHVCGGLFSVICAKNHKGFLCRTCF